MNQNIFVLIEHLHGQVAEISYTVLAAGRSLADSTGASLVALLLGHDAQALASDLDADQVWYFEHTAFADYNPDPYRQVLEGLIREQQPRLFALGDTSIGAELAGLLSARLDLPLVSSCRTLSGSNGMLKYDSQVCGGKIMVEGDLPDPTALVTMIPGGYKAEQGHRPGPPEIISQPVGAFEEFHLDLKGYIEPEASDVDISKEDLLISVGRGIQNQDDIEFAQDLADALGGVVCSSRPVVDQGWLPTSRLVGKSGKRVKPKVYLALGISGAPEHVEAITGSEMIMAVNTDPDAPIFDIAQYGAQVDLFDLLPVLTEKVRVIKGT
jgi:electron transfer flavoprotein alpha subunit